MIRNNAVLGLLLSACLTLLCAAKSARADDAPTAEQTAADASWQAAKAVMQRGPATVALIDQASLKLPEGYSFIPRKESVKLMESMGNTTDDRFLGLIFPLAEGQDWFMSIDYQHDGHISDEDAKDWKSDELLENLKEGTIEGNKFREEHGVPSIEVTRWIEPPHYEAATQRLVWSVGIKDKGKPSDEHDGVNYNTYLLGREGYLSMNLITSLKTIEAEKPIARQLLAAATFNDGRRYADFKPSTDKVAAYGLAALVGGVALKKLGILAMAGLFFAKFAKLAIVAAGGLLMAVRKFFKRGS